MQLKGIRVRTQILAIAVATACIGVFLITSADRASASTTHDESAFVSDINALRASHGLNGLAVDSRLTAEARAFAAIMAASGGIYHNPNLAAQAPADWMKLGENVGVGGDEPTLQRAFVNSPPHYQNLVDPDFRSVGIGVVYSGGRTWVVEDFMKSSGGTVPLAVSKPSPSTAPADRMERYKAVLREDG